MHKQLFIFYLAWLAFRSNKSDQSLFLQSLLEMQESQKYFIKWPFEKYNIY